MSIDVVLPRVGLTLAMDGPVGTTLAAERVTRECGSSDEIVCRTGIRRSKGIRTTIPAKDGARAVLGGAGAALSGVLAYLGSERGTKHARILSFDERLWDERDVRGHEKVPVDGQV